MNILVSLKLKMLLAVIEHSLSFTPVYFIVSGCHLCPLLLRHYFRSCSIMLHRHHSFSYRQLRLIISETEKPNPYYWWTCCSQACGTWLFLLHIVWLSQCLSVFWAPLGFPPQSLLFAFTSFLPVPQLLQIFSYKFWFLRFGKVMFFCCSFRQRAQQECAYVSAEPYVSPAWLWLWALATDFHHNEIIHLMIIYTALEESLQFRSVKDYIATMCFI